MKIISPIAIDMGAKNTGVYLNHFEPGEDPTTSGNKIGKTIVIDGNKITWSQVSRTQTRHQIRNNKRRKLAKRLLRLILTEEYGLALENGKQLEFLMGLLNRRGYNRIEMTPEEKEILSMEVVTEFFLPLIFNGETGGSLLDAISTQVAISNEGDKKHWSNILEKDILKKQSKEFKEYLTKNTPYKDQIINDLSNGLATVKKVIQTQIENYDSGHCHRKDYLKNIRQDIANSELLKPIFNNHLTAEKLTFLVGNISNLQLRALRKYFNDKDIKVGGDKWDPEKLRMLFFKWVRNWHCKHPNEKKSRKQLLTREGQLILEVLTESNPDLSIPPYEDQNNRRPPKDMTLRLNPKGLDKHIHGWESIVQSLVKKYRLPETEQNVITPICIQNGLKENVRPQKLKGKIQDTQERQILADTLHRILDRSIKLDPYKLRWLSDPSKTAEEQEARKLLNQHSSDCADRIIEFAKKYYDEVGMAKQGLWSDDGRSLFFCCNSNPPHKKNIQHELVGHIVRETLSVCELKKFKEECWSQKIGRKNVKTVAESVEETRKKYGNSFNHIMKTIGRRNWVMENKKKAITHDQKESWKKFEGLHADIEKARLDAEKIASKIAEHFGHSEEKRSKYANPYSIEQLYNHLETDIGGFNKTDKFNTAENAWRNSEETIDEIDKKTGEKTRVTVSNASRLTADSIRPFDGMLDRIITRQASEIAKMKIEQIQRLNADKNQSIFVPIFMEQNKFAFEQSLHDIKIKESMNVKKKAQDRVKKGLARQNKRWESKKQRIRGNSQYCPYTGNLIGVGEVDHIIPRSLSKQNRSVVYNSEFNLIYCSNEGNQRKGNELYTLDHLQSNYLSEVFGKSDRSVIKQEIKEFVTEIDREGYVPYSDALELMEFNYLRHALFVRELDVVMFRLLNTRYKNLVNGTQGCLGKQIRKLLQQEYPNVTVRVYQINAQEVSQLRDILGAVDGELTKPKTTAQSPFSHVIDASLVLAAALQKYKIAQELKTTNVADLSEQGEWLKNLLPNEEASLSIERVKKYNKSDISSTKIFKETLYGERFMSILLDGEKVYYGFSLDNCIAINQGAEVFSLLKSFLCFGRRNDKRLISENENLSYWQEKVRQSNHRYIYLSVDKVKSLTHLQKCAKEVCAKSLILQAEELEKLRYGVEKKKIKDVLLIGQSTKKFIKSLNDKRFKVKELELPAKADWERLICIPIKDWYGNQTTLKECFGKNEKVGFWEELSAQSGLGSGILKEKLLKINPKTGKRTQPQSIIPKDVFVQKTKTDKELTMLKDNELLAKSFGMKLMTKADLIPQKSWKALFDKFFHTNKNKNNHKHRRVRKNYSLPVVSFPSGGFRIKRRNTLTGDVVYQVSTIAGGGYACGFAKKKDGTIDWENIITIPALKGSRNVAYVGKGGDPYIQEKQNIDDMERLGNSKIVSWNSPFVKKMRLTLSEAGRIMIAITVDEDIFKQSGDSVKFKDEMKAKNIPIPRNENNVYKYSVQSHPDGIILSYSSYLSEELKKAYQNGKLTK